MAMKTLRKTASGHKPEIRIRGRQALEGLLEGVGCECEGISPRIRTSPLLQAPVEGLLRECECRLLAFFAAQYEKMRRRFILCEAELPGWSWEGPRCNRSYLQPGRELSRWAPLRLTRITSRGEAAGGAGQRRKGHWREGEKADERSEPPGSDACLTTVRRRLRWRQT